MYFASISLEFELFIMLSNLLIPVFNVFKKLSSSLKIISLTISLLTVKFSFKKSNLSKTISTNLYKKGDFRSKKL